MGAWGNYSIERKRLVMQDRGLLDGLRSLRRVREEEETPAC